MKLERKPRTRSAQSWLGPQLIELQQNLRALRRVAHRAQTSRRSDNRVRSAPSPDAIAATPPPVYLSPPSFNLASATSSCRINGAPRAQPAARIGLDAL